MDNCHDDETDNEDKTEDTEEKKDDETEEASGSKDKAQSSEDPAPAAQESVAPLTAKNVRNFEGLAVNARDFQFFAAPAAGTRQVCQMRDCTATASATCYSCKQGLCTSHTKPRSPRVKTLMDFNGIITVGSSNQSDV